jgi:hypothetical protein
LPYPQKKIRYKHYGKILEDMIQLATQYEDGETKDQLVGMLANQMKRSFLTWNKEVVDDEKIFKDLAELSGGRIITDEETHKLTETKEILSKNQQKISKKSAKKQKNKS